MDQFIAGDNDALTEQQKRGAELFLGKGGCVECHSGPNFTDDGYHNLGLGGTRAGADVGIDSMLTAGFRPDGDYSDDPIAGAEVMDEARALLESEGDALVYAFKTPTLRDVALRPRFGHLGAAISLEGWIQRYSTAARDDDAQGTLDPAYAEPKNLTDSEIDDLVAFLKALSGSPDSSQVQ